MRFWPIPDVDFYVETTPLWSRYCREPNIKWKAPKSQPPHEICYWRDLQGAKKKYIEDKDLLFKDWPKNRLRGPACLPLYYGVGNRFIRLEKAPPAGFKCAPVPLSLVEARKVKEILDKAALKNAPKPEEKEKKKKKKKLRYKLWNLCATYCFTETQTQHKICI
ncbi:hypothetical protein GQX74_013587 [Glossina fuscipes]|nr:hypothetical protein GQX74_013587 [Glossina fuscipes]